MDKSFKIIFAISVGYLIIISIFMLVHRTWFSPDQFIAAALLIVLFIGRMKQFVQDWFPFLGGTLGYEYLRSIADKLTSTAHVVPMIKFDQAVFGYIPTLKMQNALFSLGQLRWYDYLLVGVYISYFVVPLLIGFAFWMSDRHLFRRYSIALLLLSYAAFITFVIFPAAPPWMASQRGYLPPIVDVVGRTMATFPSSVSLPSVYQFFEANLVAAVPSLHAASPWVVFLFLWDRKKIWGLAFLPYVISVWFAVVYLGEHYVFDVLVGVLYATAAYWVIEKNSWMANRLSYLKKESE